MVEKFIHHLIEHAIHGVIDIKSNTLQGKFEFEFIQLLNMLEGASCESQMRNLKFIGVYISIE